MITDYHGKSINIGDRILTTDIDSRNSSSHLIKATVVSLYGQNEDTLTVEASCCPDCTRFIVRHPSSNVIVLHPFRVSGMILCDDKEFRDHQFELIGAYWTMLAEVLNYNREMISQKRHFRIEERIPKHLLREFLSIVDELNTIWED